MKRSHIFLLFGALPVVLGTFWLISTSRAATESPEYALVRADGKFEIRDYPQLSIASTPMGNGGMNSSFGQLFKFISGGNEGRQKIEMTSPVLIDTGAKSMSFIMPKAALENGVPKPAGEGVTLGKVDSGRFAVLRFAGGRTVENESAALERLKAWIEALKLHAKGEPMFAYYDPPWTPIPLRRNEVMIRISRQNN